MTGSCEFCGKGHGRRVDTVCRACDEKLKRDQAAQAASPPKRQCRKCWTRLPANRYFHCIRCEPIFTRPTEDIYEERLPDLIGVGTKQTATEDRTHD